MLPNGNEKYMTSKTGILVAAFGSSNPKAHQTLWQFDQQIRERFPGVPVRWAFTSGVIRRRLAGEGKKTDSVVKALEKMRFERYTHVAVQSLHVIPGREFTELQAQAQGFRLDAATIDPDSGQGMVDGFERIVVGLPLMATAADVDRTAAAVVRHIPEERSADEAVVLMGHGTWHEGDAMYQHLSDAVRKYDKEIYIGTMDGVGAVEDIAEELARQGTPRAWLMPLLAVVGAHALRDMSGEHAESWKSVIERKGVPCTPVLASAAERERFVAIWMDHLGQAMAQLNE